MLAEKLPAYANYGRGFAPVTGHSEDPLKQAVRNTLEIAADACATISKKHRDIYKGRTEPITREGLFSPHEEGMSDGAHECEEAVRKIIMEMV